MQALNEEESMDEDTENPAAALVQSALDRWKARCMRADNTSAIVVMFAPPKDEPLKRHGVASVETEPVKTSRKLTVKLSFHRRAVGLRKSIFIGRQGGVCARRMRWSGLLPASIFGGVRRRVRRLPASYAAKRLHPLSLGDGARRFLADRCRDMLKKSCPPRTVGYSDQSAFRVAKHVYRTSSYLKACKTVDSCERVANSQSTVCDTSARSRNASNSKNTHDLTYDTLVSLHKLNVDRFLPLDKVSLADDGNKMGSSVSSHSEVNSSSQQWLGSEWKSCCASSDSCSSAARRQHDCIKQTRLQIEALRDG
jgi:hypothetical protein